MVGIKNFRTDGSKSGTNAIAQNNSGYGWLGNTTTGEIY